MQTDRISEYLTQFAQTRSQLIEQLSRVIVGQVDVIEQIMAAIYSSSVYRAISMSLNAYGVQLDEPTDERLPKLTGGRSGQ